MSSFRVLYEYLIQDRYSAPLKKIERANKKFEKSVLKNTLALSKQSNAMDRVSKRLLNLRTAMGAFAVGATLSKMMETVNSFETSMNRIEAAISERKGVNITKAMDKMEKAAKKWGRTTPFMATQIADAMRNIVVAGRSVNETLKVTPSVMHLASIGEIELKDASLILLDTMAQFRLKFEEAPKVIDKLAVAATRTKGVVSDYAKALQNAGLQASIAGLSFDDTMVSLMTMAEVGSRGAKAGTFLMNMIREIDKEMPKVTNEFSKAGISLDKFRDQQTGLINNFSGLLKQVRMLSPRMRRDIGNAFNIRGGKAMKAIILSNTEQWDKFAKILRKSEGAGERMFKIFMKGFPGGVKEFWSALENLAIVIGQVLIPPLLLLIKLFKGLVYLFNLPIIGTILKTFVAYGLAIVLVVNGMIMFVGMTLAALSALGVFNPLLLAAAANGSVFAKSLLLINAPFKWFAFTAIPAILHLPATLIKATKALRTLTAAQLLLNTATKANPYIILFSFIAMIISLILTIPGVWDKVKQFGKEAYDAIKWMYQEILNIRDAILDIIREINDFFTSSTSRPIRTQSEILAVKQLSQKLSVNGGIKVEAMPNTKVIESNINLNTGYQDVSMVGA